MSIPPKNDAVIHFAYPNANDKAGDLGCGRFALLEGPQPGYSVAAPNASRLGRVKTAAKWLAPEAHDDSKILCEYKDFPRQNYTGNSLHLAYLLALINHVRPLKIAIQGDIWCTGAIELLADKSPFLEEVFPEEFTLKVRAFLKPANPDQLFILPAANIQPVHEDLFQKQGVRVLSVSNFETLSPQELSEGKTILKVHGDELEQLVALLFTAAPAKALRPGQNPSGLDLRHQEQTKRRQFSRRITLGLLVGLLLVSALAAFAVYQWRLTYQQRQEIFKQTEQDERQRSNAEKFRRQAQAEKEQAERARQQAERARQQAEEQQRLAEINALEKLNQTSKLLFLSHRELPALLNALRAAKRASQANIPASLESRTRIRLHEILHGMHQKNCLQGHERSLTTASFDLSGKLLASADTAGMIKLWNIATGKDMMTLRGHASSVTALRFNPAGTILASASEDKTVKLWKVSTGRVIRTLYGHEDTVTSLVFHPQGRLLISGSDDGTVRLWNVAEGVQPQNRVLHGQAAILSVAFHPHGALLAGGDAEGRILLWNLADAREPLTITGHTSMVNSLCFSPNGKILASGSGDQYSSERSITFWQAADGRKITTIQPQAGIVHSLAFSPDGALLVSGHQDQTLRLWKVENGAQVKTFYGHDDAVQSVSFSPDGDFIASAGRDNRLLLWKVGASYERPRLYGHSDFVASVAFHPNGKLLASGSWDHSVKLWDIAQQREVNTLHGHSGWVQSVAFSPDGRLLVSGSRDQTIKVWRVADGAELLTLGGHSGAVNSVTFLNEGRWLASGNDDHTVRIWDAASGHQIDVLHEHTAAIYGLGFNPVSGMLASASADHTIAIWNVFSGYRCTDLILPLEGIDSNGALVIGKRFEYSTRATKSAILHGHAKRVNSAAFHPQADVLASGSDDKSVKLWNLGNKKVQTLEGHAAPVLCLAYDPQGTLLASGDGDVSAMADHSSTIRLWDAENGEPITAFPVNSQAVFSLDFSPDGKTLASGNHDTTVTLWNFDREELLQRACRWLHVYLTSSPNVSQEERALCEDMLK